MTTTALWGKLLAYIGIRFGVGFVEMGSKAGRKRQAGDRNARFDLVISGRESFGITLLYLSC